MSFTFFFFAMQALLHPKLLHAAAFSGLLHTEAFAYVQKLFHTGIVTHRPFDAQHPAHTDTFLHRKAFTQRWVYTQGLYIQTILSTKGLDTRELLHRDVLAFSILHRIFTHSRCSTQNLAHTHAQNKCANFVMRKLPSCFYAQISKQRCVRKEYQNDHRATRRAIRQAFPVWELLEPTQWHASIERLARISCVRFGPAASKVTSRLVISPDCVSYRSSYFSLGRRLTFVCGRFLKTVAAALSQAVSLLALGCRCPRWSWK